MASVNFFARREMFCGSSRNNASARVYFSALPPSIMNVASVHGEPENPINARSVAQFFAQQTQGFVHVVRVAFTTCSTESRSTSAFVRTVNSISMPPVSRKRYGCPIASGITRMSLKRMAASKPKRRIGWSVTSVASSGFCTNSRKVYFSFSLRYSGKRAPGLAHQPDRRTIDTLATARLQKTLAEG